MLFKPMKYEKLTNEIIEKVRAGKREGLRPKEISYKTGISMQTIYRVLYPAKDKKVGEGMFDVTERDWLTGWSYQSERYRDIR
jgi:predicted DNA-binding protein (UPF0251 family)